MKKGIDDVRELFFRLRITLESVDKLEFGGKESTHLVRRRIQVVVVRLYSDDKRRHDEKNEEIYSFHVDQVCRETPIYPTM